MTDSPSAKPLGPIPQGFESRDGELVIGVRTASELAASFATTARLTMVSFIWMYSTAKGHTASRMAMFTKGTGPPANATASANSPPPTAR